MFKILFLVSLFVFHAFTSEDSWLDDIYGPKKDEQRTQDEKKLDSTDDSWLDDVYGPEFLREMEQAQDEKELDSTHELPHDWTGVLSDQYVTTVSSQNEVMVAKVAPNSNGINTTRWNSGAPLMTPNGTLGRCRPVPTMVQLDKLPGVRLIPTSHVLLHRCVGECASPLTHNCTVTTQEEVVFSVFEVRETDLQFTSKNITVYNHTGCFCNCTNRESDCDLTIHNYNVDVCSCDCIEDGSSCNTSIQSWSTRTCECQCNSVNVCDATINHIWNDTTCDCDCKQKVKDRCVRKDKVLNKETCECDCPLPQPVCDAGTSFLQYNCTCV